MHISKHAYLTPYKDGLWSKCKNTFFLVRNESLITVVIKVFKQNDFTVCIKNDTCHNVKNGWLTGRHCRPRSDLFGEQSDLGLPALFALALPNM